METCKMSTYIITGSNCRHVQAILLNCDRDQAIAYGRKIHTRGTCKDCGIELGEVYADGVIGEYAKELRKNPEARDLGRL